MLQLYQHKAVHMFQMFPHIEEVDGWKIFSRVDV